MVQMMTFGRAVSGKPEESKAIVVFGAAQCHSGFGYFPAPVKGLVRRLRRHTNVVILDEHYTSKRCSKCAFGKTELAEGRAWLTSLKRGSAGGAIGSRGDGARVVGGAPATSTGCGSAPTCIAARCGTGT